MTTVSLNETAKAQLDEIVKTIRAFNDFAIELKSITRADKARYLRLYRSLQVLHNREIDGCGLLGYVIQDGKWILNRMPKMTVETLRHAVYSLVRRISVAYAAASSREDILFWGKVHQIGQYRPAIKIKHVESLSSDGTQPKQQTAGDSTIARAA